MATGFNLYALLFFFFEREYTAMKKKKIYFTSKLLQSHELAQVRNDRTFRFTCHHVSTCTSHYTGLGYFVYDALSTIYKYYYFFLFCFVLITFSAARPPGAHVTIFARKISCIAYFRYIILTIITTSDKIMYTSIHARTMMIIIYCMRVGYSWSDCGVSSRDIIFAHG